MFAQLPAAAAYAADFVRTTFIAAWPRSTARYEVTRLREEGHVPAAPCPMAFSLCVGEGADAAMVAQRAAAAGWTVDAAEARRGFLTVTAPVRLRAFDLAWAQARLERLVAPHGGYVAIIGPEQGPGAAAPDARRERILPGSPTLAA